MISSDGIAAYALMELHGESKTAETAAPAAEDTGTKVEE